MNKYYIRKNEDCGVCIRFGSIEWYDGNKNFVLQDLTFLDGYGFLISPDRKGWAIDDGESKNFNYKMLSSRKKYIFEFENDEEALLFYEVMDI